MSKIFGLIANIFFRIYTQTIGAQQTQQFFQSYFETSPKLQICILNNVNKNSTYYFFFKYDNSMNLFFQI
jgi:hypothetical protein